MSLFQFFVVGVSFFSLECFGLSIYRQGKIIGGKDTDITKIPWQTALLDSRGLFFCGGVIISETYILTAAHCVKGMDINQVRIGSSSPMKGGTIYKLKRAKSHPKYGSYDYDIAVLQLEKSIVFDKTAMPIKIGSIYPEIGKTAVLSGYGRMKINGGVAKHLQSVHVKIISREECGRYYSRLIPNRVICTYGELMASDRGDSGGPLVVDDVLYGIISWGRKENAAEGPTASAFVADEGIREFIRNETGL